MLKLRYTEDAALEAGVDEAGRGSFWGPLMAAAVIWPAEADWTDEIRKLSPQIRDSKKVSPKKRAVLADAIRKHAVSYGVGTVSAQELDDYGVTWANQTAFQRAAEALQSQPQRLLIDGILACTYRDCEVVTIIEGDATYISVAAASILAKEAHDDWVRAFCEAEPAMAARNSLLSCKGYGTAKHREGLKLHGPHEHHRRRFLNGGGSKEGGYTRKEKAGGSGSGCLIKIEEEAALFSSAAVK